MRMSNRNSDIRKYLEGIIQIQLNIKSKQMQLAELNERTQSVTACIKPDFVKTGSRKSSFENALIKMEEVKKALEKDIEILAYKVEDINKRLDNMYEKYPKEANLLRLRYVNAMNCEATSEKMYCSLATMHRIHMKALEIFKEYIK